MQTELNALNHLCLLSSIGFFCSAILGLCTVISSGKFFKLTVLTVVFLVTSILSSIIGYNQTKYLLQNELSQDAVLSSLVRTAVIKDCQSTSFAKCNFNNDSVSSTAVTLYIKQKYSRLDLPSWFDAVNFEHAYIKVKENMDSLNQLRQQSAQTNVNVAIESNPIK